MAAALPTRLAAAELGLMAGPWYSQTKIDELPAAVVDALCRGVLSREGDVAVHFAAMLTFLHGQAAEAFDWAQRPFFLRFHTADRREREAAFRELCAKIGVRAEDHLAD